MAKRKVSVSFIEFIPGFGVAVGNAGEVFEGSDEIVAELVARGKLPVGKDKKPADEGSEAQDDASQAAADAQDEQEGAPA